MALMLQSYMYHVNHNYELYDSSYLQHDKFPHQLLAEFYHIKTTSITLFSSIIVIESDINGTSVTLDN